MSNCPALDHMPKGLSHLKQLKVLKGFFISYEYHSYSHKSCTLHDLLKLEKLEKLCICTNDEYFHLREHVRDLEKMATLTKLTIAWGVRDRYFRKVPKFGTKLPPNLKKLHLKAFPGSDTPSWLKVENLRGIHLKTLYITGARLYDLGQYQGIDDASESGSTVEVLRLKHLGELEMDWRQFRGLFPRLKYLEKVGCPKLTLFPCDAKGVWINTTEEEAKPVQETN